MAALTHRVLSFALCMQMLTFHFQKYLSEAKVQSSAQPSPERVPVTVIYPALISSFSASFLPEHVRDPRGDLIFGVFFMSHTCLNICRLLFFPPANAQSFRMIYMLISVCLLVLYGSDIDFFYITPAVFCEKT